MTHSESIKKEVSNYYGKTLNSSLDLKTDACCTENIYPEYIKKIISLLSDEVVTKYYGCGLVIPKKLTGLKVLDLGSGSGRDVFILSKLVGENGKVYGVDMTDEQISVARNNIEYHKIKFGHTNTNVSFFKGDIEKLNELPLKPESLDLIVSNCVINLATDKNAVLKQAYELLKPGGELYFSDVYSDRKIPKILQEDPILYGECLSGALYWNDFIQLAKQNNFTDPRLIEDHKLSINNPEILNKCQGINFYSATYRLFKIKELEVNCEDYGQAVVYQGGINDSEQVFKLDNHHFIDRDKVFPVCGNTYRMLNQTRFKEHFKFIGNFSNHYGIFKDCGINIPFSSANNDIESSSCC